MTVHGHFKWVPREEEEGQGMLVVGVDPEDVRALGRTCSRSMRNHGEAGGHFCLAHTAKSGLTTNITVVKNRQYSVMDI